MELEEELARLKKDLVKKQRKLQKCKRHDRVKQHVRNVINNQDKQPLDISQPSLVSQESPRTKSSLPVVLTESYVIRPSVSFCLPDDTKENTCENESTYKFDGLSKRGWNTNNCVDNACEKQLCQTSSRYSKSYLRSPEMLHVSSEDSQYMDPSQHEVECQSCNMLQHDIKNQAFIASDSICMSLPGEAGTQQNPLYNTMGCKVFGSHLGDVLGTGNDELGTSSVPSDVLTDNPGIEIETDAYLNTLTDGSLSEASSQPIVAVHVKPKEDSPLRQLILDIPNKMIKTHNGNDVEVKCVEKKTHKIKLHRNDNISMSIPGVVEYAESSFSTTVDDMEVHSQSKQYPDISCSRGRAKNSHSRCSRSNEILNFSYLDDEFNDMYSQVKTRRRRTQSLLNSSDSCPTYLSQFNNSFPQSSSSNVFWSQDVQFTSPSHESQENSCSKFHETSDFNLNSEKVFPSHRLQNTSVPLQSGEGDLLTKFSFPRFPKYALAQSTQQEVDFYLPDDEFGKIKPTNAINKVESYPVNVQLSSDATNHFNQSKVSCPSVKSFTEKLSKTVSESPSINISFNKQRQRGKTRRKGHGWSRVKARKKVSDQLSDIEEVTQKVKAKIDMQDTCTKATTSCSGTGECSEMEQEDSNKCQNFVICEEDLPPDVVPEEKNLEIGQEHCDNNIGPVRGKTATQRFPVNDAAGVSLCRFLSEVAVLVYTQEELWLLGNVNNKLVPFHNWKPGKNCMVKEARLNVLTLDDTTEQLCILVSLMTTSCWQLIILRVSGFNMLNGGSTVTVIPVNLSKSIIWSEGSLWPLCAIVGSKLCVAASSLHTTDLFLYSLDDGGVICEFEPTDTVVHSLVSCRGQEMAVLGVAKHKAYIWNVKTGLLLMMTSLHVACFHCPAAYVEGGLVFLVLIGVHSDESGILAVFNPMKSKENTTCTLKTFGKTLHDLPKQCSCSYSVDGNVMSCVSPSGDLELWSLYDGELLASATEKYFAASVLENTSGPLVVLASKQDIILVYLNYRIVLVK